MCLSLLFCYHQVGEAGGKDGKWSVQAAKCAEKLHRFCEGLPPWSAGKQLRGLTRTARTTSVIDMCFAKHVSSAATAAETRKEKLRKKDVSTLAIGLLCDVSQSLGRNGVNYHCPAFTTQTTLYSYSLDRAILPEEHFRVLQHTPKN